jgi:DNA-binding IclR family transcriptional regulator
VLKKGLELLELIAKSREGLNITQLEKATSMHRSTIYRYLNAFAAYGYLERFQGGRYRLGPKILELASLILDRLDIRDVARPLLIELSERTDATVHLCRLDGTEVVYLDKIETSRSLPLYSRIGARAPAYCTGVGKAILAFLPPERLERVLERINFRRYTPNTITNRADLLAELEATRKRGYAVDRGEHEEGIYCVAAPIFDLYGEPIASISVTDLARKISKREKWYAQMVLKTAQSISNALGQERDDDW